MINDNLLIDVLLAAILDFKIAAIFTYFGVCIFTSELIRELKMVTYL